MPQDVDFWGVFVDEKTKAVVFLGAAKAQKNKADRV